MQKIQGQRSQSFVLLQYMSYIYKHMKPRPRHFELFLKSFFLREKCQGASARKRKRSAPKKKRKRSVEHAAFFLLLLEAKKKGAWRLLLFGGDGASLAHTLCGR
jgi:hypothetical protein